MLIFARSRSCGTNTIVFNLAFRPCAAVAPAKFPVDGHASVSKPNSTVFVVATETTRSLNECVGFAVSFLIHRLSRPRTSPRLSALSSGVIPAPISTAFAESAGRRSPYRHSVAGPRSIDSRLIERLTAS